MTMNRTVVVIAALVLALTLAWYVVPLPDGDAPPATTAPMTQPAPAPEAAPIPPAAPPTGTPKQ